MIVKSIRGRRAIETRVWFELSAILTAERSRNRTRDVDTDREAGIRQRNR
jgi:hypothetical protein